MLEKHSQHKNAGFYMTDNIWLWVSFDGKTAKLGQWKNKLKNTVVLKCNLSNHGCKQIRKVKLEVKIVKLWKPKKKPIWIL